MAPARAKATRKKAAKSSSTSKHKAKAKNRRASRVRKEIVSTSSLDWKNVACLGEKLNTMKLLRQGIPGTNEEWDFSHLEGVVRGAFQENPNSDLFLLGGSPQPFDLYGQDGRVCPSIVIIIMPRGFQPPPYVAIQHFQHGSDRILPFRALKLDWKTVDFAGEGFVFTLECKVRESATKSMLEEDLIRYEYASLFTMRPSTEWVRKADGELDIQEAIFSYDVRDGDIPEHERYEKGSGLRPTIVDFCERFELDIDEHYDNVKRAIRDAFARERKLKENRIALLADYDPEVLDGMTYWKVFPRNDIIQTRNPYLNQYYGRASKVV